MPVQSKPISGEEPLAWPVGTPLLPLTVLLQWGEERLPDWACTALSLPAEARMNRLADVWSCRQPPPKSIESFLVFLVHSRRESIGDLPAIQHPWPPDLAFEDVQWRRRTTNCLKRVGWHHRLSELAQVTFAELFAIPTMGAVSILDFACTLEATIKRCNEVMSTAGVPIAQKQSALSQTLLDALEEPWADCVSGEDPRFADLLPSGVGTLTERIDRLTASPEATEAEFDALADSVVKIRNRIREMQNVPLEVAARELMIAVSGVKRDKHINALLARFNWDGGREAKTLEAAGTMLGVTRERIRQLQSRTLKRMPSHPVVMPALDRALHCLEASPSVDPSSASELLRKEGVTKGPFHPASVLSIARSCGKIPRLRLELVNDREVLIPDAVDYSIAQLLRIAQAQASTSGVSNVFDWVSEAESRHMIKSTPEHARELLRGLGELEFLNEDWFWNPKRLQDSLRQLTRKMLSVANPIEVGTLREGVKRAFRFRRISGAGRTRAPNVPPRDILAAYYRAHPEFVLSDTGLVRPAKPLDYRQELVGVEQVLARVLRASPTNVLDRTSLLEGCVAFGVNPSTLWTILSYSSIVQHIAPGVWSLRGIHVNAAAVEAIRQAEAMRPRERRVMDYGWAPDGELWIAVRLPRLADLQVFGVPSAVKRFLENEEFLAYTETGEACGRLKVYENGNCGGFEKFLHRFGADEGDVMHVSFDLTRRAATLRLIDDEDLEELSPVA